MRLIVEPGLYEVMIGSSSEDIRLTGSFEILGNPRVISGLRRKLFTDVIIK